MVPQQHLHGGQWDIGIDPGERIVGEAVIQKGFGVFKALSGGGRLHHHGDEFHAVPLGGGGDAVQGGIGGTGLEAGGSLIEADQTVGVCETEGTVPDGVHPDGGVLPDAGMVEDQLPGHEGDVVSGGEVALGGEAGAVDEVGVSHAQLTGPEVHLGNKGGPRCRKDTRPWPQRRHCRRPQ